jgi:hypothetical protein
MPMLIADVVDNIRRGLASAVLDTSGDAGYSKYIYEQSILADILLKRISD